MTAPAIIDGHCHVASDHFTPRSFIRASLANVDAMMRAGGVRMPPERLIDPAIRSMQDHQADALVQAMDEAGIARTILLCPDFTYVLRDCVLTIDEMLLEHRAIAARHPGRFAVFAGVDPRWGSDGVDLFERALRDFGFAGFKVYPPCGFTASDRGLYPFYELCAHYRVPVTIHTGPSSSALAFEVARPMGVDAAAMAFPTVNFILAHASISFTDECIMLAEFRPNVYMDVSGFQASLRTAAGLARLTALLEQGVSHKILFGTDWPVFRQDGTLRESVQAFQADDGPLCRLDGRRRALVMGGNAERILSREQPAADRVASSAPA